MSFRRDLRFLWETCVVGRGSSSEIELRRTRWGERDLLEISAEALRLREDCLYHLAQQGL